MTRRVTLLLVVGALIAALFVERHVRGAAETDDASAHDGSAADPSAIMLSAARTASLRDAKLRVVRPIVAGTLRLEGLVTDQEDRPVAGVRVSISEDRVTTTEADGSFAFDGLAEGEYDVVAEQGDAFVEAQGTRLDDTSDPVTLQLLRGPTLVIHVADAARQPIAGAKVEIIGREKLTGADGTVRFRAVATDSEMVSVSAPGHAAARERVDTSDDPAVTIERNIALRSGAEVSGTVVDTAGKPIEEAYVELEPIGGGRSETVYSDAQGAWHLPDVGRGKYNARASSNDGIAVADVAVTTDGVHVTQGIVLRVEPGGEIAGLVVDTADHPVAEARISGGGIGETTDKNGKFVAKGLRPDKYQFSISTPMLGAPDRTVQLARGQHVDVKIVLVPSSLAGTVVDAQGNPVEDASVMARSDADGYGYDRTDAYGHFDLGGLPPGRYEVTAQREGSRVEGKEVIASTGNRQIRLSVPEPAQITGRVLLAGVPVPYFGVAVVEDPTDSYSRTTPVRDPAGRFTEKDAKLGTFAVVIVGPTFGRHVIKDVTVTSGHVTDLGDIAVEVGASLHGRVTDDRGAGVAGATVRVVASRASYTSAGLDSIMEGMPFATTDARGNYEIIGVPPSTDERMIQATHPTLGASQVRTFGPAETTIDLVLAPTGSIDGTIRNRNADITLIVASRTDDRPGRYYGDLDADDAFHFGDLPPGEYKLEVLGKLTLSPTIVAVAGGRATSVTIEAPAHPVELRVHLAGCNMIGLHLPGAEDTFVGRSCTDGVATFPSIGPGAYSVCPEFVDCRAIVVPQQPAYDLAL